MIQHSVKLSFRLVGSEDAASVALIASLAAGIWREHFTPILGSGQVEYMLEKFQSAKAVAAQIASGYRYYLMVAPDGGAAGYFALVPRENELFLSKIYISCADRGKGYARQAIGYAETIAREKKLGKIRLTVNKKNLNSIAAYQKMGFAVYDTAVTDIGSGYVMDDYLMERIIAE